MTPNHKIYKRTSHTFKAKQLKFVYAINEYTFCFVFDRGVYSQCILGHLGIPVRNHAQNAVGIYINIGTYSYCIYLHI